MAVGLLQAHAMAMSLAWMVFGSTGILIAHYGRSLRLGNRRQLLGKAVWFQIHRFLLSMNPLLTLLGFFFILVKTGGQWVTPQFIDVRVFVHSILGGIAVCCAIIQIWLALYRCHPQSRFRFIFDWTHRIIGLSAFILSILNIFIITMAFSKFFPKLVPVVSCWVAWIVIVIIIFERIQYQQRVSVLPGNNQENINANPRPDIELGANTNAGSQRHNQIKLLLFLIHIIISIVLCILFIVFISQ